MTTTAQPTAILPLEPFQKKNEVAFVFSSKNRLNLTRASLESVDVVGGFELVWLDGSTEKESRDFVGSFQPKHAHVAGRFLDVGGGPDAVITGGLRLLNNSGYALCGLIENDIQFDPGWFATIMNLFDRGRQLGLNVGAASVRTLDSRTLAYGPDYALMWDIGAGMILFTRPAVEIVLANYGHTNSMQLAQFYHQRFGVNLQDRWEIWRGHPNPGLSCDWRYCMELYRHNLACLGSIPTMARNIDTDIPAFTRSFYVTQTKPCPHFDRVVHLLRDLTRT